MSAIRDISKAVSEDETGNLGCGIGCLSIVIFMVLIGFINSTARMVFGDPHPRECAAACGVNGVASVDSLHCVCNDPCPTIPETTP